MRPIRLGEIVVRETAGPDVSAPFSEQHISLAAIRRRDAAVVSDLGKLVPAAHVQTNSRGETLIYLRNAGERQVAVFFEGALLNIPWDNRVDLSVIPASAVGGMTVAQGVPPIEYGANVLGGAVNLTAKRPAGYWSESSVAARYGTAGQLHAALTHARRRDRLSYTGAVSVASADGRPVPGGAELPYSQPAGELRTNTDYQVTNLFASAVHEAGSASRVGVTFLHMNADKGVAPEGHLDPAQSSVRFWRYPNWRHTTAIVHGQGVTARAAWKGAAWITSFGQDIDAYDSASYGTVEEHEENADLTLGSRFVLSVQGGPGLAKLAFNALTSTHKQRDFASGVPTGPRMTYQTHVVSAGGEYELPVSNAWRFSAGSSVDAMFAPKTGDKPDQDPFVDYSVTFGVTRLVAADGFVRVALGRKTRFPTMRELFGTALNRFLLNPDLKPESSVLGEVAVGTRGSAFSGEIITFGRFTTNTIDQINVLLPGETRSRRQRINLRGSDVIGVELVATAAPVDRLSMQGHLTLMHVRRRPDAPSDPTRLSEKPSAIGRLSLGYDWNRGTSAMVETVYTGKAYSLDESNTFVPLDPSLAINVRVEQRVELTDAQALSVFVRADNVTDATVLPQLGLPDAGRSVSGGVQFSF